MYFWEPIFWYQFDTLLYSLNFDYIQLLYLLIVSTGIILIGLLGLLRRVSVVHLLLSLELILLGINILILLLTLYFNNPQGYLCIFILLTLAASESAIGISILILFYRIRQNISINFFMQLQF